MPDLFCIGAFLAILSHEASESAVAAGAFTVHRIQRDRMSGEMGGDSSGALLDVVVLVWYRENLSPHMVPSVD